MIRGEKRKPEVDSPVGERTVVKKCQRKAKQQDPQELQGEEMESQLHEAITQDDRSSTASSSEVLSVSQNEELDNRIYSFFDEFEEVTLVGFKTAYPVAELLETFKDNPKINGQTTGCYEIIRHTTRDKNPIMVPKKAINKKFQEIFDIDLALRKEEMKKKQEAEQMRLKDEAEKRKKQFLNKQLGSSSKNYPIFSKPSSATGSSALFAKTSVLTSSASTTAKSTLTIVRKKKQIVPSVSSIPQTVRPVSYYLHPTASIKPSVTLVTPSITKQASTIASTSMLPEDISSESDNEDDYPEYNGNFDSNLNDSPILLEEQLQTQLYLVEQESQQMLGSQRVPVQSIPTLEQNQMDSAIQSLQVQVKQLHTELEYLRDVCIPMVKRIGRVFGSFDVVDRREYPYTEIPIGVSKEEWQLIHPIIFGGTDERGTQLWAETAPLKIENGIAVKTSDRAGQEKVRHNILCFY